MITVRHHARGFSLLELIVVLAIISVLFSIALPFFVQYRERARATSCQATRRQIEMDEAAYALEHGAPGLSIDARYRCPSGGEYLWIISDPESEGYPMAGCSAHFFPSTLSRMIDIPGYVAGYSMDEGEGSQTKVGNYTADIHGAQWVEGKVGSALRFDGKNDYAQTDVADWEGPFTVMTWVKADPVKHQQYDSVFSSGTKGPKNDNFQIDSDGKGNYRFHGGRNHSNVTIGEITGDWQLIAVTFDGGTVTTYNNGELVDSGQWNGSGKFTEYAIGRNRNFNKKFTGTIDELGIFDRAVDSEEITAYYQKTQ